MSELAKRLRNAAACAPTFGPLLTEAAEAAEEIERLKKEVAKLRKATEWQPIETVPSGKVLLYYPEQTGQNPLSEWIIIGLGWAKTFRKATHWMPLPKPPAVEGES